MRRHDADHGLGAGLAAHDLDLVRDGEDSRPAPADARPWPTARRGARAAPACASRARHSASWSPRLVPASACTSSTITHSGRRTTAAHRAGSSRRQAFRRGQQEVRRRARAGAPRGWRRVAGAASRCGPAGASPRPAASGCGRCRWPAPSAGEIERVQRPALGRGRRLRRRPELDQRGQEPGQRLAAAGRRDQQHALALLRRSSIASWCGRGVQPRWRTSRKTGSGNVPPCPLGRVPQVAMARHPTSPHLAESDAAGPLLRARRFLHRSGRAVDRAR